MGENVVFLRFHVLYLFHIMCYLYNAQGHSCADRPAKPYRGQFIRKKVLATITAIFIKLVPVFLVHVF